MLTAEQLVAVVRKQLEAAHVGGLMMVHRMERIVHEHDLRCLLSHIAEQERRIGEMREAILWALGEHGEFPARPEGKGQYYWRSELRARAALGNKESTT